MWTDTHCHLNAPELADECDAIARQAADLQVSRIVIPAIDRAGFTSVRQLALRHPNCAYALGIHPSCVVDANEDDLKVMRTLLEASMADPQFVGIGEIGLDFYKPERKEGPLREKQEYFYVEQLKMAREMGLPVLLHSLRAVDTVLRHLRQIKTQGGVAHAFNGSLQQAHAFIELGFMLSFTGNFTYDRAQNLRRLAVELPLDAIVIETDAPDLPPAWLNKTFNTPKELPRIGAELAVLRGITPEALAAVTTENALRVMPRLSSLPI